MPRTLRISAISFLNTAPLMWDFEHGHVPTSGAPRPCAGALSDFELEYTVPSQCAEALQSGTADIGIIPSIAYAAIPGLVILPDAVIAAKSAVRSILLVSRREIADVKTIAADTSSRTSVALTQILCEKFWGGARELRPMPPQLDTMLAACDAALLIGDAALRVDRSRYVVYDLAEQWRSLTGLPFVFAFWAMRLPALAEARRDLDVAAVFRNSRDHGLEPDNVATIARHWAPPLGLSAEDVVRYLTQHVHYCLDAENQQGLELFYRYAVECALIAEAPQLRFVGSKAYAHLL